VERVIRKVIPTDMPQEKVLRVAAYARVSCDNDDMRHSLNLQVSHYSQYIQSHPGWAYAGVYMEQPHTGTSEARPEFQHMLTDCRAGLIDLILVKSISRLGRNTVTLLNAVRELRDLGIGIYFEEENINTLNEDGELLLTLMASFAQEESRSVSENCKWRIRSGFKEGRASTCTMMGYRLRKGSITLIPDEAEIVRQIFGLYLEGYGPQAIANMLTEAGVDSRLESEYWSATTITAMLRNEKYCGDLLLQKTITLDHLEKKQVLNEGQLPQYFVEDDHEAIIDREVFEAVQEEIRQRAERFSSPKGNTSELTSLVRCGICGHSYHRRTTPCRIIWGCTTYVRRGKKHCPSNCIPEETLKDACCKALGLRKYDAESVSVMIKGIEALPGNILRFTLTNGEKQDIPWEFPSRSESWTAEMRRNAAKIAHKRKEASGLD